MTLVGFVGKSTLKMVRGRVCGRIAQGRCSIETTNSIVSNTYAWHQEKICQRQQVKTEPFWEGNMETEVENFDGKS